MSKSSILTFLSLLVLVFSTPRKVQSMSKEDFLKSMGVPSEPLVRNLIEEPQEDETEEPPEDEPEKEPEKNSTDTDSEDESKMINVKCLWANKYDMYSLQSLQNKEKDYEVVFDSGKIIFNFCQNTITKVNGKSSGSTFLWENKGNLIKLTGSIDGEGDLKNKWGELIEENNTGLMIRFVQGDTCEFSENDEKHETNLKVICDPEVNDEEFLDTVDLSNFENDTCIHTISVRSFYGCKLNSLYLLKRLFANYKYVVAVLFILVGLFLCIFGYRYISITVMAVTAIIGSYLLTVCMLSFFPHLVTTETRVFLFLAGGFFLGLVAGFYLKGEVRGYVVLLGGVLGYSSATFAYQIVQEYVTWDPQILYYITLGVCCMIGLILGICMYKIILTFGTAAFGGYLAMRGGSFIIGNYLDENQVIDLIKNREFEQLKELRGPWVYGYLGAWALMTTIGTIVQCRYANANKKKGVR